MFRIHLQMNFGLELASTEVEVLAPFYGDGADRMGIPEDEYYGKKFKCIWLLHGLGGTCEDWIRFTQVETWAQEKDVFVICPSGGSSFYTDGPMGYKWDTLITTMEWQYLHRMFPMMSGKPEDNLVAGLSMGGYGAMYYALRHPDKFGYGCSLSGGLNMPQRYAEGENITRRLQFAFGEPESVKDGPFDLYKIAKDLKESGKNIPRIYISCGQQDWEYEPNQAYRDYMIQLGYDVTWDEADYTHEWRMWNEQIKKVLDFMVPEDFCKAKTTRDHVEE